MIEEREARPPRKRRFGKRPGQEPPEPEVGFTRATVALATSPLESAEDIEQFERSLGDESEREELAERALATVNRAIHGAAVARVEPQVTERGRSNALAIRWGHGSGEELAVGNYTLAREETAPRRTRRRRADDAVGQERLAAMLGNHDSPDAAETLILRASLDLAAGRAREAAIMLSAAVQMLSQGPAGRELSRDGEQAGDLAALTALADELQEIATDALRRHPGQVETERIREACRIAERILRRRKVRRG